MVIIQVKKELNSKTFHGVNAYIQKQAARGVIVLPHGCEVVYAGPCKPGKAYTIRKGGVICDASDLPNCGYTERELAELKKAGFELHRAETMDDLLATGTDRGPGDTCQRWGECYGVDAENCPLCSGGECRPAAAQNT